MTCSLCTTKEPKFTKAQSKKPAAQRVCVDCAVRAEQIERSLKSQKLLLKILDHTTFALPGETLTFPRVGGFSKFTLQVDISFKCLNHSFVLNFVASSLIPITVGVLTAQLLAEADLKDFPVQFLVGGKPLSVPQKTLWADAVPDPSTTVELGVDPISVEEEILKLHYERRKANAPGDDLVLLLALQCEPEFFKTRALERIDSSFTKGIPRFSSKVLLDYIISTFPDPPFRLHMQILDLLDLFQVPYPVLEQQFDLTASFATDSQLHAELVTKKQTINEKLNKDYWDNHNILALLGPAMISRSIFPHLDLDSLRLISRSSKGLNQAFNENSYWEIFCKRIYSAHMFGVKRSPSWKSLFYCIHTTAKHSHCYRLDIFYNCKVDSSDRWVPLLNRCVSEPDETTITQLLAVLKNVSIHDLNSHLILWRFLLRYESFKAPKFNFLEWIKILLEHGSDPNLPQMNMSMLAYAIIKQWVDVAQLLCLHGASIDHPSIPTAMHLISNYPFQPRDNDPVDPATKFGEFHELLMTKIAQIQDHSGKRAIKFRVSRGWYHVVWGYPRIKSDFNSSFYWAEFQSWPDHRDIGGFCSYGYSQSMCLPPPMRTKIIPQAIKRSFVRTSFIQIQPFQKIPDLQTLTTEPRERDGYGVPRHDF